MVYIRRMRAQTRPTDDISGLKRAEHLLMGSRYQDLNIRSNIKTGIVIESSSGGWLSGRSSSQSGYLDVVLNFPEATTLEDAYRTMAGISMDTAPEDDSYQIDFCPAAPKIVQLDDKDFPNPMKIQRLPIPSSAYNEPVKRNKPLDKRLGYKFSIRCVNYFPQEDWKKVNKALIDRKGDEIPASFWWFKSAAEKAIVVITTKVADVHGYPVPFVDINLESSRAAENKGLFGEIKDSFKGFHSWYFERMNLGRDVSYARNSAISFLDNPKNPNGLQLRRALEEQRRFDNGLEDLKSVESFLDGKDDLKALGVSMERSVQGRQANPLTPCVSIKDGTLFEEQQPEIPSADKDNQTRVIRYYKVREYSGTEIDIENAFTPEDRR